MEVCVDCVGRAMFGFGVNQVTGWLYFMNL